MESIEADAHQITRDLEVADASHGDIATKDKLHTCVGNDYYRGLLANGRSDEADYRHQLFEDYLNRYNYHDIKFWYEVYQRKALEECDG